MTVIIELAVNCSAVEEMLSAKHNLEEPVRLTHVEHDEMGDLCAFVFEVDEEDVPKIDRGWDTDDFAAGLIEESI
jgi:hypothetical protein